MLEPGRGTADIADRAAEARRAAASFAEATHADRLRIVDELRDANAALLRARRDGERRRRGDASHASNASSSKPSSVDAWLGLLPAPSPVDAHAPARLVNLSNAPAGERRRGASGTARDPRRRLDRDAGKRDDADDRARRRHRPRDPWARRRRPIAARVAATPPPTTVFSANVATTSSSRWRDSSRTIAHPGKCATNCAWSRPRRPRRRAADRFDSRGGPGTPCFSARRAKTRTKTRRNPPDGGDARWSISPRVSARSSEDGTNTRPNRTRDRPPGDGSVPREDAMDPAGDLAVGAPRARRSWTSRRGARSERRTANPETPPRDCATSPRRVEAGCASIRPCETRVARRTTSRVGRWRRRSGGTESKAARTTLSDGHSDGRESEEENAVARVPASVPLVRGRERFGTRGRRCFGTVRGETVREVVRKRRR